MSLTSAIGKELQSRRLVHPTLVFPPQQIEPRVRYSQSQNLIRTPESLLPEPLSPIVDVAKPVFQLSYFPLVIDPSDYANPQSNTNPNGNYLALYAFHQLVDPIPTFTRYYSPTNASTERVYGNLVNGASVVPGSEYTRLLISSAQETFSHSKLPNFSGLPGTWHPDYATPEDWWDRTQVNRFKTITIDLENLGSEDGPYTILNGGQGEEELFWRIGNSQKSSLEVKAVDRKTKLKSLSLKCLEVQIRRTAWLDYQVFQTQGWYLQGQPKGFCSTGTTGNNNGIIPLIPTSFIVAIDAEISADWATADRRILDMAVRGDRAISLGAFALSSLSSGQLSQSQLPNLSANPLTSRHTPSFTANFKNFNTIMSPTWQIVAWISSLIPLSPQTEDLVHRHW